MTPLNGKYFRRFVKGEAKKQLKRHRLVSVILSFLLILLGGGYTMISLKENTGTEASTQGASVNQAVSQIIQNQTLIDTTKVDQTSTDVAQGVISLVISSVSEEQNIPVGIMNAFNELVFKGRISRTLIILLALVLYIAFILFVKNVLEVGAMRTLLEQRKYEETPLSTVTMVYRYRRTRHIAYVLMIRDLKLFAWSLTIIGGIIKEYEYSMIPFLLAENPDISAKEAFALSKQLTHRRKADFFLIELSFLPLYILNVLTLGILEIIHISPLLLWVKTESYMYLRSYQKVEPELAALMNDGALSLPIRTAASYPREAFAHQAISLPDFRQPNYDKNYPIPTLVLFFFTFSIVGYVWEVFYNLLNTGTFANRGFLSGPWLPIYGVGGLLILILLRKYRNNPGQTFVMAILVCGVLEYTTGWALETFFHMKWWDYTGYYLNLDGRVCLEGLLVFGLAGIAFTYTFAPMLDSLYAHIPKKLVIPTCIALVVIFAIDLVASLINPNTGDGINSTIVSFLQSAAGRHLL